jgi:hypothetical protein
MKKFWHDTNAEYDLHNTERKKQLDAIFQRKIQKYLPPKEVKVPVHRYSLRMFANYIGCWWFDIVFGHDDTRPMKARGKTKFTMHKRAGYIQVTNPGQSMYGVFVNANSKMAYINQIFKRSETECQRCVADFRLWCEEEKHKYPIVKIISDYEGGMANIAGIERHVAKENHKRFGIIDGFVNAARQWNWAQGYGAHLTPLHFRHFVNNVWNKDLVRGTQYTREQMIANSDYEEEYIAKCIYFNADQLERRREVIHVGQQARLAYENRKEPFERRPGDLMPGVFEIVSTSVEGQPGKMLVRNSKGKISEATKTQVRRLVQPKESESESEDERRGVNDPVITEITPEMLENLPEQSVDNLRLVPVPQHVPANSAQLAQQYEASIEDIKEQLVKEVVSEINKRKDAEITRGFMPLSRPEQVNKAFETTTENAELAKRKHIFGSRNRQFIDRTKIRRAAKEILDEVMVKFKLPEELNDGQFHKAGKIYTRKITHNEQPSKAVNPLVGNG